MAISETWLRSSNTNKSIAIDGFKIIRADRKGSRNDRNKGGGVAIYLNDQFKHKIIFNSAKDNLGFSFIDFLAIEIYTPRSKIIFCVVYRTNKC